MPHISPAYALQRLNTAQLEGLSMAPAKDRPELVVFYENNGNIYKSDGNIYLFRNGQGGLILPAYDDLPPLLGECADGDFTSEIPPSMNAWLQDYTDEIDWLHEGSRLIEYDEPDADDGGDGGVADTPRKSIPAICKATWGQGAPYNDLLTFDGERCVTGCWATAVGIIMEHLAQKGYHRGCTKTTKYGYTGNPHTIEALPPITCFDYRNIVPKPKSEKEKAAVATLMKYIGAACKSRYSATCTTSWVNIAMPMLKSRLRLGSGIKAVADTSVTAAAFEQIVYDEIAAGRPVILRGANEAGTGGHFFVADGYRLKDEKYHVNWGWDGRYNGYFALYALTPAKGYDYTFGKWIVYGFAPEYILGDINADGRVNITDVMVLLDKIQSGEAPEFADINSDGKVDAADMTVIINTILGKQML